MEWFFFLFVGLLFFISIFLIREKYTIFRLFLFTSISLLFGLLLFTGINFPSGTTSTIVGSTITQTTTYTTYLASLDGANSFPLLYGLAWVLVLLGVFGLLYSLIEVFRWIFYPNERQIKMV